MPARCLQMLPQRTVWGLALGSYSGKLWLAQKLKVCLIKHPQGFREGGVRGGRELGHLRGRSPWPLGAHFAQKVRQSRSHELPLPKKLQKDC